MNPAPEVLKLLRCPVTGSALVPLDPESLEWWNRQIASGQVDNRAGQTVRFQLDGALVNTDQSLMVPVHDGIIVMLDDELIPTSQAGVRCPATGADE